MTDAPSLDNDSKNENEGYGDMTRAWFDAGAQVAELEAAKTAERRRLVVVTVGILAAIGLSIGLLWLVG